MTSAARIYHYTSITSLALILKTRKLRFSRLDSVDDIREAQFHSGVNFGRYFFVSCWTKQSLESIPQWNMYGQAMQGVRIELPEYPFNEIPMVPPKAWSGVTVNDGLCAPLPFAELFGDTYFLMPLFTPRKNFASDVNYVADVATEYKQAVSREIQPDGKTVNLKIGNLYGLPFLKSSDWEFQSEYRFSLFAIPSKKVSVSEPADADYFGEFGSHISNSFINNLDHGVSYIDLPLSSHAIRSLVIRTGPLSSPGEKACLEALIARFAPDATIESSALAGTIRQRK